MRDAGPSMLCDVEAAKMLGTVDDGVVPIELQILELPENA